MDTPAEGERAGWPVTRLARANGEVCLIHYFLNVSLSLNAHACYLGKRKVRRITSPGDLFGCPIFRDMPAPINRVEIPNDVAGEDGIQRAERKRWNDGAGQNARFHVGNYAYGPLCK